MLRVIVFKSLRKDNNGGIGIGKCKVVLILNYRFAEVQVF